MAATIEQDLQDLAETFDLLGDWEERYRYLIELGDALEAFPEAARDEAHRVRGCASQVWLVAERLPDGRIRFLADSDAHIVRGLIAVLLRLYSERRAEDIAAFDARIAVERLGLSEALSSQRANGLAAMVERIRREAGAVLAG